jgi:DNA invertase Pin-like site-specific DNA recombinase
LKPLIYGYLRVAEEMDDAMIRRDEEALATFAATEGYCLGAIFHEYERGSIAAFTELLHALRRSETRHVVVPSLVQLSGNPMLQRTMVREAALYAGATIHQTDSLQPTEEGKQR